MDDVELAWKGNDDTLAARDGYPSVANFIAHDPDHESYVFRKFSYLTARKLLYMQSGLISLEQQLERLEYRLMQDPEHRLAMKDWEVFQENAEKIPEVREYKRLQELLYAKLEDYHRALKTQKDIAYLEQPSERVLTAYRNNFHGKDKDKYKLKGSSKYMLDDETDLIALKALADSTLLSKFVLNHWPFQTTPASDGHGEQRYLEERWLNRFVGICCVSMALVLLVGSILALYFVDSGHIKLALVIVFILLFAVGISVSTNASRDSIFAGTAAYAAVLVVLDALKNRLQLPARLRGSRQPYRTLDGLHEDRDAVAWYWRLLAVASSFMILGAFLMLPSTFDNDPQLRLSKVVLGSFAGSLLIAGFALTAALSLRVSNPLFQADSLYLPSVTSCAVGLLTIFYDFLISSRYQWTIAATLITITAGVSTLIYGGLLIWTQRRINIVMKTGLSTGHVDPLRPSSQQRVDDTWADPAYYKNYLPNMFPAAVPQTARTTYDPGALTEEEQQRQQMLMLLLQKNNASASKPGGQSSAAAAAGSYHLEWQDRDQEDAAPLPPHGFYAPDPGSESELEADYPTGTSQAAVVPGSRENVRSWNGVWNGPGPLPGSATSTLNTGLPPGRPRSWQEREARRRQIESGMP